MFRKLFGDCQSRPMTRDEALTFWISIGAIALSTLASLVF